MMTQSYGWKPQRLQHSRNEMKLRQLHLVRSSLIEESAKTLVHTFVSSHLDYCNSLLYGVSDELLLQVIQKVAARVVMGARKFDHITRCFTNSTGCLSASASGSSWR